MKKGLREFFADPANLGRELFAIYAAGGAAHAHRERVVHPRNIRGGLPGGLALPGRKGTGRRPYMTSRRCGAP